jgi:L-asparaginase II
MERKNPFVPLDSRPLPPSGLKPLEVALMRGMAIESRHQVHALVCDSSGRIMHQWGDPELTFFPRSTVKIIQAAAWVSRGRDRGWSIGDDELAIACGSHMAEPGHVEIVKRWLEKLGLPQSSLECGPHEPTHRPSVHALVRAGEEPCPIHNNCSGKHCGLLMACLNAGWPTAGYSNYDHPVQEELRQTMGEFLGFDLKAAPWGIDGCGIPSYSVSLRSLAIAMARTADPSALDSQIQEAIDRISRAIKARPELIGGTENFSSQVVAETEGRVFAKVGAEGVYGAWIPGEGIGVALKCEDGTGRAAEAALGSVLRELGFPLSFYSPLVTRWGGEVVGQFLCG